MFCHKNLKASLENSAATIPPSALPSIILGPAKREPVARPPATTPATTCANYLISLALHRIINPFHALLARSPGILLVSHHNCLKVCLYVPDYLCVFAGCPINNPRLFPLAEKNICAELVIM